MNNYEKKCCKLKLEAMRARMQSPVRKRNDGDAAAKGKGKGKDKNGKGGKGDEKGSRPGTPRGDDKKKGKACPLCGKLNCSAKACKAPPTALAASDPNASASAGVTDK